MADDDNAEFERTKEIGQILLSENTYLKKSGWTSRVHLEKRRVVWFPPGADPETSNRVYDHDGALTEQRRRDAKHWTEYQRINADLHPLGDREIKGDLPPTVSVL